MKTKLALILGLAAATLLGGCIVRTPAYGYYDGYGYSYRTPRPHHHGHYHRARPVHGRRW